MAQESEEKKVYMVLVMMEDGSLGQCAAIRHQGMLWLVPKWLDSPNRQMTTPERIIGLPGFQIQKGGRLGDWEFDFAVVSPIPKSVFEGQIPKQLEGKIVVIEQPEIYFQKPTEH